MYFWQSCRPILAKPLRQIRNNDISIIWLSPLLFEFKQNVGSNDRTLTFTFPLVLAFGSHRVVAWKLVDVFQWRGKAITIKTPLKKSWKSRPCHRCKSMVEGYGWIPFPVHRPCLVPWHGKCYIGTKKELIQSRWRWRTKPVTSQWILCGRRWQYPSSTWKNSDMFTMEDEVEGKPSRNNIVLAPREFFEYLCT